MTIELLFWLCAIVVIYTYVGYGAVLWIVVKLKGLRTKDKGLRTKDKGLRTKDKGQGTKDKGLRTKDKALGDEASRFVRATDGIHNAAMTKRDASSPTPPVTLLICAYNEREIVDEKMANTRELDYPDLRVVWVTDGSDDGTADVLRERYPDITVLHQPERRGKTAAMNRAMTHIDTPIVVMTDANTVLNRECISEIVRCFDDPTVGCVAGEKRILATDGNLAAQGEGAYWRYESTLKRWDSELYSAMGAAGELIALRTELYEAVPEDSLLDDFVLSMRLVMRGWRIAYCPTAYACEGGCPNLAEEQKRKQRIAAGGLQSVWRLRGLLNPWRYGVASWQYVSHRVLRWTVAPLCLMALIPLNVLLVIDDTGAFYTLVWIAQLVFYTLAAFGVKIPAYFTFMNINVLRGARYLWQRRRSKSGAWEKTVRA